MLKILLVGIIAKEDIRRKIKTIILKNGAYLAHIFRKNTHSLVDHGGFVGLKAANFFTKIIIHGRILLVRRTR